MGCAESRSESKTVSSQPVKKSKKLQFDMYALIKQDKIDEIKELLKTSFDINFRMPAFVGRTVLHIAAESGNKALVEYLLVSNANPNILDQSGCPPIFLAMKEGHLNIVSSIFNMGKDVDLNVVTVHNLSFHDFINKSKYKDSIALLRKLNYSKIGSMMARNN